MINFDENLLMALLLFSLLCLVLTMVTLPWVLIKLPEDYFLPDRDKRPQLFQQKHPVLYLLLKVVRNILAILLLLLGVILLFLPGQGLLSILAGIILADFPGKYALETKIINYRGVLKVINRIRTRAGKKPLRTESQNNR